jgi:hypothetical protein
MLDYQIQASSRRCVVSGRELKPGEVYYTVLLDRAGKFIRQDYSVEAWQGCPEDAFSFWKGRILVKEGERKLVIDDELLLECFHRLENDTEPSRQQFRYVVALLLMRRKRFKFEDVRLDNGQERLRLRCTATKALHEVLNPHLTDEQMEAVQEEVFKVLGWQ